MRKIRLPEVHYYEWSVSRWRGSLTFKLLDITGKGIFRELLDQCYDQGSIPADPELQALIAGCTPSQLSEAWPHIKKHFLVHKKDSSKLTNIQADFQRRNILSTYKNARINGSKGGRPKKGINKPNNGIDIETTWLEEQNLKRTKENERELNETKGNETKERVRFSAPASPHEFPDFVKACEYAELSYSPDDLKQAKPIFEFLDPDQKRECCEGLRARKDAGEYDDPQFRPLPQNYVREKRWKRPIRDRRASAVDPKMAEATKIYEQRKREKREALKT